ncbi:MAG TPA: CHAT domain-containing tetratricopeptide repeat protein [Actinomycetes bacterium]|nr:CHAT domain-containing tetratricopeptide repeat protein [Actinomycetes bacterium]
MAGEEGRGARAPHAPLELLPLALSRPREALTQARAVLAAGPGPYDASVAHQVVGIVLRDFGDVGSAIRELRTARSLARASGSPGREADVLATLGIALVFAGRTRSGLAALDAAVQQADGVLAGQVLARRGAMMMVLGRHREALDDLRPAVTLLARAGDPVWEARARTFRALVHLALGAPERADVDVVRAERLFAAAGQELESAVARQNRGFIAFRTGDLPVALAHLDEAARRYESLGTAVPDLSIDRCAVLLAAGLPREALQEADAAIRGLEQIRGQATKRAELLLTAASAALAAADTQAALERAQAANRLFGRQQREWWRAHATLLLLQASFTAGMASGRLLGRAGRTAAHLEALGSGEAPRAHLLAGRTALTLGRLADADRHLAAAARMRRRGPALSRATGWLAAALRAAAAGDTRRVLDACRRGLDLLDEHRLTLGASELRALATAQGAELAALAQRQAVRAGAARRLLAWSERWRATAMAVPPVRPPDDHQLQADLTAVRQVTSRLEQARAQGTPTGALQREQRRLEHAIRTRVMQARGTAGTADHAGSRFDVGALLEELGPALLVEIVDVDGDLHVLVCGAGKVRRFAAGRADEAKREVEFARFGLRRLAYSGSAERAEATLALLEGTGRRLEELFLGPASRHLGDGAVVVAPPGRLHAVPWALLPSLRDRVLSVAPSANVWLRARRAVPPAGRDVVLVVGPDLDTGGAEVPALAGKYDSVTVLDRGRATAARVLDAIDGAWLAHVAAHGSFRADSPLFSSLRLDDGPLTVHDLERLRRAPYRLVLPSCDSGLLAPVGADELLGLTSSLVPLGTVGIVASVVPVNDRAVVPLMLALHERLRHGATLAESLRDARWSLDADPVMAATGWSFVALGAG